MEASGLVYEGSARASLTLSLPPPQPTHILRQTFHNVNLMLCLAGCMDCQAVSTNHWRDSESTDTATHLP